MKKVGIITIHRIFNYGSIFQAYALQEVCKSLGNEVEMIDYMFPNQWHQSNGIQEKKEETSHTKSTSRWKQFLLKMLFAYPLWKQHCTIRDFINKYLLLTDDTYKNPDDLAVLRDRYDVCIVGSDQVWNPRYCKCDPAFFLTFASDSCVKAAYASSFGVHFIDDAAVRDKYATWLKRFAFLSVREKTGVDIIEGLTRQEAKHVVDPTLLLTTRDWNKIAVPHRIVKQKYILCYFLNYTFDAFPRVNEIADYISKTMGWKIVYVARPPHRLCSPNTKFKVGASPAEFLALIRDAELVLTTSFHGAAFSLNYDKPLYAVVESKNSVDSRVLGLLNSVGLSHRVLALNDALPSATDFLNCDNAMAHHKLEEMREVSLHYLKQLCV